ncbi:uncharacterized protein LACBIDRAFT_311123 [Laccaria bicolor S238N-H82]|uniref:Predicted protein n=1 Tax=Laccaria bicolor (strain S238N-H82 / ATCC MYA-4686) TaxID=486041 RepID=B0CZA4_LACBS|nr:uncharacterized protein LACBIDRAFT_311123 [Laccaria bicolor S238N-H82]EDR12119.1 predicted protein [Laccaria bicolor S238N-H82]|eukprot:XP_001876383.1 predicted protein [Laccaria bicolor S238N-H82]
MARATSNSLSHSPSLSKMLVHGGDTIVAPVKEAYFAFALIKGNVFLVQVSHATPASALTTVDVKIFRHEFITIFRFSEATSLHPADICILEPIDEKLTRYEEENETVFLAKDLMDKLRKMTDPRRRFQSRRCSMQRQRQW